MRKIEDVVEIQRILLSIAIEFKRICKKYNIPYYMLGGTMLGAIRHKGFIPWDDDMDFGVPYEYYPRLKELLQAELDKNYRCLFYEKNESIYYPFIKIDDRRTVIDDPRLSIGISKKHGINIDIFPLVKCDITSPNIKRIKILLRIQRFIFINNCNNAIKNFIKTIFRKIVPFDKNYLLRRIEKEIDKIEQGDYLGNIMGRWGYKEIIHQEKYGLNTEYKFENIFFSGIKKYDDYLKNIYGDYMTLPKESNRIAHVDDVYYR